jgi:hypothetical protein
MEKLNKWYALHEAYLSDNTSVGESEIGLRFTSVEDCHTVAKLGRLTDYTIVLVTPDAEGYVSDKGYKRVFATDNVPVWEKAWKDSQTKKYNKKQEITDEYNALPSEIVAVDRGGIKIVLRRKDAKSDSLNRGKYALSSEMTFTGKDNHGWHSLERYITSPWQGKSKLLKKKFAQDMHGVFSKDRWVTITPEKEKEYISIAQEAFDKYVELSDKIDAVVNKLREV